jgi:hypothetical protein
LPNRKIRLRPFAKVAEAVFPELCRRVIGRIEGNAEKAYLFAALGIIGSWLGEIAEMLRTSGCSNPAAGIWTR